MPNVTMRPARGSGERSSHGFAEGVGVGDHVVGGHDEHQRVALVLGEEQRSHRRSRCRVAADRLDDERAGGDAELPELLGQNEAVLLVAHHHRRCEPRGVGRAQDRCPERASARRRAPGAASGTALGTAATVVSPTRRTTPPDGCVAPPWRRDVSRTAPWRTSSLVSAGALGHPAASDFGAKARVPRDPLGAAQQRPEVFRTRQTLLSGSAALPASATRPMTLAVGVPDPVRPHRCRSEADGEYLHSWTLT